ncbi:MAG: GAF domain-containing sensor histidine kinase [Pseudomonadota bacterium]
MKNSIAADVAAIQSISAVPTILQVITETTGLRFSCIARVTDDSWTACAVLDNIGLGLMPGGELELATTLCNEVRNNQAPIIIDDVSNDKQYCNHLTPKMYKFQSYLSFPLYRVNGEYFGTLCALDPLPANLSNSKTLSTMKLFAELISLQLEAEAKLDESQAALLNERETAELREQFIGILGHDVRSPLSSVISGADALLTVSSDERIRNIAERIRRSGQRISSLVDDVLDFTRGKMGGGISLGLSNTTALAEDLQHGVAELQATFPKREILCEFNLTNNICCDRKRVVQLLSNLLSNALVHGTADKPVTVAASDGDDRFLLAVTNEGPVIPSENMTRLFQPYWRGGTTQPQSGLGLGLYIASEIARAHGGKLDVASSEQFTSFIFSLPLLAQDYSRKQNSL